MAQTKFSHRLFLFISNIFSVDKTCRETSQEEIRKMNRYFGVHGETYSRLQFMRSEILEILRLNVLTAILIVASGIPEMIDVRRGEVPVLTRIVGGIYFFSNPLVYIAILVDLRKHYLKYISKNRIEPTPLRQ